MMTSHSMHHYQKIELIAFGWIRISNIKMKKIIPLTIKHIVTKFAQNCFKLSNILNINQDLSLIQLLNKQLSNKFKICDLIYRASDYFFDYEEFHNKFNEEKYKHLAGNVVIIKSYTGNIFGGFTSKSWNAAKEGQITDKYAFLFLLKSNSDIRVPIIFKLKEHQESEAIYYFKNCGPIFGAGHDIFIGKFNNCSLQSYYNENSNLSTDSLIRSFEGNTSTFDVEDFEVFGLITSSFEQSVFSNNNV